MRFQIKHLFSLCLYRITALFSLALKGVSEESWEKLVDRMDAGVSHGIRKTQSGAPDPFKQNPPERLAVKEYQPDETHHIKEKTLPPDWSHEITTFLGNQLSDHTRRAYESDLKQFFRFSSRYVDLRNIRDLKPSHIILFRKVLEEGRLTGRVYGKTTINRKLAVIKSFLNWLKANQFISENAAQFVKGYPQSQESALKGLSDEETRKILELPNRNSRAGSLHYAILHTLFFLGIRKGELIGLKLGDLDTERGIRVLRVRGKGHRVRILPITEMVAYAIDHYLKVNRHSKEDKEGPLFRPTKNNRTHELFKKMNPNAITYIVERYAKKAGVLKKISPHSCRATCISNALDNRATHRSVQHLAGWSTPLMIQRYDKRREDLKNSAAFQVDYGEEEKEATA